MMSALKIPKFSPTTGLIDGKAPITEAPLVQLLSSSSERDDHDIGYEFAPHDAGKFSNMTEEKIQVTAPRRSYHLGKLLPLKVFFLFHPWFLLSNI